MVGRYWIDRAAVPKSLAKRYRIIMHFSRFVIGMRTAKSNYYKDDSQERKKLKKIRYDGGGNLEVLKNHCGR